MVSLSEEKEKFLKYQFWILAVSASFSRASVYKQGASESRRQDFKRTMFYAVNDYAANLVHAESEGMVVSIIRTLVHHSNNYDDILEGGKLRFGVAQKLLNLYAKYLWCAGFLDKAPPHFPLDRVIQKGTKIINWTECDDEKEYLRKINELCPAENKAEWELIEYNKQFYK